jgi:hypothetical protein
MRRNHPRTRKTGAHRGSRRWVACFLISGFVTTIVGGCGAVHIQGALDSDIASVSGFVSGVQIIAVPGANGTVTLVTVVTLQQTMGFTTTNFCGNVGTQFPMHSFAQVSFNPGQPCSTITVIVIS